MGAQRRGGDAGGSIALLSKNRAMWAERIINLQKEYQIVKRNIMIALVATLLICILPLYLLGGDLDISVIPLCQISAVVLIGICMLIYVKADKKLCRSWIEKETDSSGMDRKYLQVRDYDEVKEAKSSQKMAVIPAILFIGAFVYFQNIAVLVAGIVVVLFFLNQHKVGHNLAKKKVATTTMENRLESGIKAQVDIFGDGMKNFYQSGPEESKHINRWLAENCFGDYYTRTGLDYKQREIITFCFLAAQGGCEPQLTSHAAANIRLGNNKQFLINVISQCLPFIGYPRSLNALSCVNKASENMDK